MGPYDWPGLGLPCCQGARANFCGWQLSPDPGTGRKQSIPLHRGGGGGAPEGGVRRANPGPRMFQPSAGGGSVSASRWVGPGRGCSRHPLLPQARGSETPPRVPARQPGCPGARPRPRRQSTRCKHLPPRPPGVAPWGFLLLTGTRRPFITRPHIWEHSGAVWPGQEAEALTPGQTNGGGGGSAVATAGPGRPSPPPRAAPCDRILDAGHKRCVTSLVQEGGGPAPRVGSHQQAGAAKATEGP